MGHCITNLGYSAVCDESIGGIKTIAIFEYAGIDWDSLVVSDFMVSALDVNTDYSGFTYQFVEDNATWTDPSVGDGALVNSHWEPNVNMIFKKMSSTLNMEMHELSKNKVVIFLQDNNDNYWIVGDYRGLRMTDSDGGTTGAAMSDPNQVSVNFKGMATHPAYQFDKDTVDVLIGGLF